MNAIDTFPGEELPLRETLPKISDATRGKLIHWGMTQPGSLPWLRARSEAYFKKFPAVKNSEYLALDAVAALDLLRWRIDETHDRMAVEHLKLPLEKGHHEIP